MERSISFKMRGRVPTNVTVTETGDGSLKFELEAQEGWRGQPDLRGLFFDLAGVDVNDLKLHADGRDITGVAVCEGRITRVESDVSVYGRGVRKHGAFDVGIAFGGKGFGDDQITSTSFTLSGCDTDLTLDMVNLADFGLRYDTQNAPKFRGWRREDRDDDACDDKDARDRKNKHRDDKDDDDDDRGTHKDHGQDHDNGYHKGHTKQHKSGHPGVGIAQNDALQVAENDTGSLDILANDVSGWGRCWSPSSKVWAVDGLERDGRKFTGDLVSHDGIDLGTLTIHRRGEATFEARADALAEGEVREVPLRYTTGSFGRSKTAWIVVTVTGANDAPEISIDGEDSIEAALELRDSLATAEGTLSVTDVDLSDEVTAEVTKVDVSGSYAGHLPADCVLEDLMMVSDGAVVASGETEGEVQWSFAATDQGVDIPQGETLVLAYEITVSDSAGVEVTQTVTITLTGTQKNEPPVLSVEEGDTASVALTESDGPLSAQGSLTVSDAPTDSVTLSVTGVTMAGTTGSLTTAQCLEMFSLPGSALAGDEVAESFEWAFYSGDETFDFLPHGETVELVYTVAATDEAGEIAYHEIALTITGTAEAPVLSAGQMQVSESGAAELDLADLVSGGDTALSFEITSGATNGQASMNGSVLSFDTAAAFEHLSQGEVETFDLTLSVSDTFGSLSENSVTVTVVGENDAPVGVDDSVEVSEDGPGLVITVLDNDSDADRADTLSVTEVDASSVLGLLVLNPDGSFAYDPNGAFEGLASGEVAFETFTYRASDTTGALTDPISVTIQINGAHDAPVLGAGELAITESGSGQIDLSTLVSGGETQLSFGILSGPSNGTAQISGSVLSFDTGGAFEYLAVGEVAMFDIVVSVSDTEGGVSENVVSVSITGENDTPIGTADHAVVSEDGPGLVMDVLNNDSDQDANEVLSVAEFDASSLLGVLVLNNDNTFTYDPNGAFDGLTLGESAIETFTYRAKDTAGALTDPITVTIQVEGAHDAPELAPGTIEISESESGQIDLAALVTDAETALVFDMTSGPAEGLAQLVGSMLSFDTDGAFEALAAGEVASVDIGVLVSDTHGGVSENRVTVTVIGENDAPIGTHDDVIVGEDGPGTVIDVLSNDIDLDAGDTLRVAEFDASTLLGFLTLNPDGTFSYDPSGAFEYLAKGDIASETFTYRAADDAGSLTDPITVIIQIEGAHDAPVIADGALTVQESGAGQIDLGPLVAGGETALSFDVTGTSVGGQAEINGSMLSFDAQGAFEHLGEGEETIFDIGVSVSDTEGGVSDGVITVTVIGQNDAPIGRDDTAVVGEDGPGVVIDVLGNDEDADQNDTLSVASFDTSVTVGLVTLNPDGTFTYDPNEAFEALGSGETGTDRFTYRAMDGNGVPTDPITVTIQIDGAHDAPVLAAGTLNVTESGAAEIDLAALVSGGETSLSFDVVAAPANGMAAVDGSVLSFDTSGAFEYLAKGETAAFDIAVSVTDTELGLSENVVTVTVTGENDNPIGVDDFADVGEDGPGIVIDVLSNDIDADTADTLSIYEFDASSALGLVALNSDGTFSYDPNGQFEDLGVSEVAYDSFTYRAVDSNGALSEPVTVTVRIDGAHDQAEIMNAGFESGLAGWDTVGTATTVGRQSLISETGTVDPIEGAKMLRLYSLGAGDGTIANFLGQSLTALEAADGDSDLIVGAAAKTVIENVAVGDVLAFDWFFDAGDNVAFNDSALVLTMNGDFVELSDVSDVGDWGSSGWQTTTMTATTAGDLTIAFAVFNAGDAGQNSALYVDDLQFL